MEFGIGCCCNDGRIIDITWSRFIRLVGAVSPHADLSDFTESWTDRNGYLVAIPPGGPFSPLLEYKMRPVRYELGAKQLEGYDFHAEAIRYGQDIGPRDTAPPLTGHLKSISVSNFTIPSPLSILSRRGPGFPRNVAASVLRAVEVFRNGVSIGLFDFGRTVEMYNHIVAGNALFATHANVVIYPENAIELNADDVFTVDYYLHLITENGYVGDGFGIAANAYLGTSIVFSCGVFSAGTATTNSIRMKRYKISFSDHGPSGLSEIRFQDQAGWEYGFVKDSGLATLTKIDGSYSIRFNWGREVPYVELVIPSAAGPGLFTGIIQYRPVASGDYDPILLITTTQTNPPPVEYGVWNPAAATVFSNRLRYAPNSAQFAQQWYSDVNLPTLFADFPATVSISPV